MNTLFGLLFSGILLAAHTPATAAGETQDHPQAAAAETKDPTRPSGGTVAKAGPKQLQRGASEKRASSRKRKKAGSEAAEGSASPPVEEAKGAAVAGPATAREAQAAVAAGEKLEAEENGTADEEAAPKAGRAAKVVGTDAKGRTIYEGPRGGHYYIGPGGKKRYVSRSPQ